MTPVDKEVLTFIGFLINFAAIVFSFARINYKIDRRVTQLEIWLKILIRNVHVDPNTLRSSDLDELNRDNREG